MNSRRKGEDLLPRIAPIPRSLSRTDRPGRMAPGLCRGLAEAASRIAAALGRGLTVLPVLELLGIGLLVLLLGR